VQPLDGAQCTQRSLSGQTDRASRRPPKRTTASAGHTLTSQGAGRAARATSIPPQPGQTVSAPSVDRPPLSGQLRTRASPEERAERTEGTGRAIASIPRPVRWRLSTGRRNPCGCQQQAGIARCAPSAKRGPSRSVRPAPSAGRYSSAAGRPTEGRRQPVRMVAGRGTSKRPSVGRQRFSPAPSARSRATDRRSRTPFAGRRQHRPGQWEARRSADAR